MLDVNLNSRFHMVNADGNKPMTVAGSSNSTEELQHPSSALDG